MKENDKQTIQEIIENEYAKMGNAIREILNAFRLERQSASKAYTKMLVIEYTDANRLELRDNGIIYDSVILLADSNNSDTIYVGGSNPLYPLSAGQSVTLRKKNLYDIYFKGSIGDKLIILC